MDSGGLEDVLILAVDPSCDCLCLGGEKSKRNNFTVDKGKAPVNSSRRAFTKKISKAKTESMSQERPVIILDDSSGSETDYIEMGCAQPPLNDTAASAFPNVCNQFLFKSEAVCNTVGPQTGSEFCLLLPQSTTDFADLNPSVLPDTTVTDNEALPPSAKKVQLTPPASSECLFTNTYSNNACSNGNSTRNDMDTSSGNSEHGSVVNMETDEPCHQHTSPKSTQLNTTIPLTQRNDESQLTPTTISSGTCTVLTSTQFQQLSSTDADFELAIKLDQQLNSEKPMSKEDEKVLKMDEEMAKKLQQEEYLKGMRSSKHGDERLARNLLADELYAYSVQKDSTQKPPNDKLRDNNEACSSTSNPQSSNTDGSVSNSSSSSSLGVTKSSSNDQLKRYPTCWTSCPNCAPDLPHKYHLIDVEPQSAEWDVVTSSLTHVKFHVTRVQRIQNEALWQRLCFEKQLMLRERQDVNEQLLYHTSRAAKEVICEEGLDPRLSRNGYFGVGMYFRCVCFCVHMLPISTIIPKPS